MIIFAFYFEFEAHEIHLPRWNTHSKREFKTPERKEKSNVGLSCLLSLTISYYSKQRDVLILLNAFSTLNLMRNNVTKLKYC